MIAVYLSVYKEGLLFSLQKSGDPVRGANGSEHVLKCGLLSSICKESTRNKRDDDQCVVVMAMEVREVGKGCLWNLIFYLCTTLTF